jgi:hypothetical protein
MILPDSGSQQPNGWLSRYRELVRLMYDIRRQCPRLEALGISTLNPRHPLPPDQLRLMEEFSTTDGACAAVPSIWTIVSKWLWLVLFACRDTVGLLWLRLRFRSILLRAARQPATVILKTWCFGPDSMAASGDFYYGTLPQQLQVRGLACLLLCGDARGRIDPAFVQAALGRRDIRAIPEQLLIPLAAPLRIAFRQLRTTLHLRRLAARSGPGRVATVCAAASLEGLEPIVLRNTYQFFVAKRAVTRWRATVFVTFYEGQPWEQPAWHGAKAANPDCVTVGYQHTILMPYSFSLLSPNHDSWELSSPDVVLCLGEVTRGMMAKRHLPRGNRLVTFGTFRQAATADAMQAPQPGRRTVLVLPEGNLPESKRLFNFAMRVAAIVPDHRFIFRCHPLLPFDQVHAHLDARPERLANIVISTQDSIVTDFDRSSVILYRGSSAVLYAVLHGLKPIYFHDEAHHDIDPLFELTTWRQRVSSPGEIAEALQRFAAADDTAVAKPWKDAAAYVHAYTQPVGEASIDRFLQAVGLSHSRVMG